MQFWMAERSSGLGRVKALVWCSLVRLAGRRVVWW